MAGLEEGVLYRTDRNGNVKRVEDTNSSKKSRKKSTADDKSEPVASD
ncbi:hypothetical protein PP419_gp58 [Microbacterium phage vB_MoxS-R1]|uniref:Uncharacterized protein n=1 Tax=Microbacterium phage vB_MoxS-R1 TaxID=2848881 RepID=A0A8F2E4N9_9CAUD|nr:hypothetical protein PP419_gp58 [Microbacterium phage vB_MoxS-R1]QWT28905.1 hypothetical protein vBMoxSR1_gp55 [Microbacterium phage vB_MoxS-R1]